MTVDLSAFCAVIPVKPFCKAKQRLSPLLSAEQRAALARAMLDDVLAAVAGVGFGRIAIVTADNDAAQLAASRGAAVIREPEQRGIDAAIATAREHDVLRGVRGLVVMPADIPLAASGDIAAALAPLAASPGVVIARARDGGTNLLALAPPDAIAPAFGPDSAARHADAARTAGLSPHVLDIASLAHDIDTPNDLRAFMARATRTRTQTFLSNLLAPPTTSHAVIVRECG